MATSQDLVLRDDTRSSLVHRWAAAELQNLSFSGDCNALAQYVEILVENFCDSDTSDLEGLREHVRADLVDFIGADLARRFSDGLVKHLAKHADFLNRDPDLDEPYPASSSDHVDPVDNPTLEDPGQLAEHVKSAETTVPADTARTGLEVSESVVPAERPSPQLVAHAEHIDVKPAAKLEEPKTSTEPVDAEASADPTTSVAPSNLLSASQPPDSGNNVNPSAEFEKKVALVNTGPSSRAVNSTPKQPSHDRDRHPRHTSRDREDRYQARNDRYGRRDGQDRPYLERQHTRDFQPYHRVTRPSVMERLGERPDLSARPSQHERDGNMRFTSPTRHLSHTHDRFNSREREQDRNRAVGYHSSGPRDRPDPRNRDSRAHRDPRDYSIRDTTSSPGRRIQSSENVRDRLGSRPVQSLKRSRDEHDHSSREGDAPVSKRRSLDHERRAQDHRPRQVSSLKRPRDEDDYASQDVAPVKKRVSSESEKVGTTTRPRSPTRAGLATSNNASKPVMPMGTNTVVPPSQAPLPHPPLPTLEQMASSGHPWPFPPEMLSVMGMPPFFPVPPGPFPPTVSPNGVPMPPLPGAPFVPATRPGSGKSTEAVKRPPGKMNSSGNSTNAAPSKHRHFILFAKNIPSESLMVGPIFAFFQRFGIVLDVVKAPPNKAFILFESRDSAVAALRSVEAVMGNRHITLTWAKGSDFSEAGLIITDDGKLIERPIGFNQTDRANTPNTAGVKPVVPVGSTKRAGKPHRVDESKESGTVEAQRSEKVSTSGKVITEEAGAASKSASNGDGSVVDLEAAADDLRRKREKIAAMRKEQEAQRAQRFQKYQGLVKVQKDLFEEIQGCTDDGKKAELMNKLRRAQSDALRVRKEMNPSASRVCDSAKSPSGSEAVSPGHMERQRSSANDPTDPKESFLKGGKSDGTPSRPKYGRDLSTFQVDNRPKVILVSGSGNVPEALAVAVFRDTERVAKVEDGWLIELSSRRAAESAMRAIGPLKRGFGPNATAQIVSRSLPASTGKQSTKEDALVGNGGAGSASVRKRKFSEEVKAPPQAHWKNPRINTNVYVGAGRGFVQGITGFKGVASQAQVAGRGVAPKMFEPVMNVEGAARPTPFVARAPTNTPPVRQETASNQGPVMVKKEGVPQSQAHQSFEAHEQDAMMD